MGFSVKITETQKDFINEILASRMSADNLKKGQALAEVVLDYTRSQSLDEEEASPDPEFRDPSMDSINCGYLKLGKDFTWYCFENVHKKKKPEELGGDRDRVVDLCLACLQRKYELAQLARDKELKKEAIKKLDRFMRRYSQLAQDGFNVEAHICTANEIEGSLVFSRDGRFLACPLMMDEGGLPHLVPIEDHCKEKIDQGSGTRGCSYLTILSRLVKLDKEFMEAEGVIMPNVDQPPQGPPANARMVPALEVEGELVTEEEFNIELDPEEEL